MALKIATEITEHSEVVVELKSISTIPNLAIVHAPSYLKAPNYRER